MHCSLFMKQSIDLAENLTRFFAFSTQKNLRKFSQVFQIKTAKSKCVTPNNTNLEVELQCIIHCSCPTITKERGSPSGYTNTIRLNCVINFWRGTRYSREAARTRRFAHHPTQPHPTCFPPYRARFLVEKKKYIYSSGTGCKRGHTFSGTGVRAKLRKFLP